MLKINQKILNICLQSMLKNIGYYEVNFGKIHYIINLSDLSKRYKNKDTCILELPSIDEIKSRLLKINRFFDVSGIDDIQYSFVEGKDFDKSIVIKSNSNINFDYHIPYNFEKDIVINANRVVFNSCYVHEKSNLKINSKTIYMNRCGIMSNNAELKAKEIYLFASSLNSNDIGIDDDKIFLSSSEMRCNNLKLRCNDMKKNNSSFIKSNNSIVNGFNSHITSESSESLDKNPVLKIVK